MAVSKSNTRADKETEVKQQIIIRSRSDQFKIPMTF